MGHPILTTQFLFAYIYITMSTCLCICLPVNLFARRSVLVLVCLIFSFFLFVFLSVCPSCLLNVLIFCLFVYWHVCVHVYRVVVLFSSDLGIDAGHDKSGNVEAEGGRDERIR